MRGTANARADRMKMDDAGFKFGGFLMHLAAAEEDIMYDASIPKGVYLLDDGQIRWDQLLLRDQEIRGCLHDFIRLYDATDAGVISYIQNWGLLYRSVVMRWRDKDGNVVRARRMFSEKEKINNWRKYSAQLRAILLILVDHKEEKASKDRSLWMEVSEGDHIIANRLCLASLDEQRAAIASKINIWCPRLSFWTGFQFAGSRGSSHSTPSLADRLDDIRPSATVTFRMAESGELARICRASTEEEIHRYQEDLQFWCDMPSLLWDAIGYELVGAVTSDIYRCSICEEPFPRRTKEYSLRGRKRQFCSDACHHEASKEAKRRWAANKRSLIKSGSDAAARLPS